MVVESTVDEEGQPKLKTNRSYAFECSLVTYYRFTFESFPLFECNIAGNQVHLKNQHQHNPDTLILGLRIWPGSEENIIGTVMLIH